MKKATKGMREILYSFLTNHWSYLAHRYGFVQKGVQSMNAEDVTKRIN